jgi:hypothetical protein
MPCRRGGRGRILRESDHFVDHSEGHCLVVEDHGPLLAQRRLEPQLDFLPTQLRSVEEVPTCPSIAVSPQVPALGPAAPPHPMLEYQEYGRGSREEALRLSFLLPTPVWRQAKTASPTRFFDQGCRHRRPRQKRAAAVCHPRPASIRWRNVVRCHRWPS